MKGSEEKTTTSGKYAVAVLPYCSCEIQLNILDKICKTNIRRFESGEKTDQRGALGPKE